MKESPTAGIAAVRNMDRLVLPDTPYAMWVRGELDDYLHVPDGFKAEVIGGEIVVSPAPLYPHAGIVGAYPQRESWNFGETVKLPQPFGIEIPTDRWRPWRD